MDIKRMEEDLEVIAKLDDEPNDVDGLSSDALKHEFDKAGLLLQTFLNGSLIPQLTAAFAGVLADAMQYADGKVVDIGAGDMAMAVYDPERRKEDVYAFAERAAQLAAQAARDDVERVYALAKWYGKGLIATSSSGGSSGTGGGAKTWPAILKPMFDEGGLLSADGATITVPAGVSNLFLVLTLDWGAGSLADCEIDIRVNGVVKATRSGPQGGQRVVQSWWVALPVQGGDVIQMDLRADYGGINPTYESSIYLRDLRLEVMG